VETGRLDLNAMVSRRIKLDEINDAFRAMQAGEVIRSVIVGDDSGSKAAKKTSASASKGR
jgi:hypothetical protein